MLPLSAKDRQAGDRRSCSCTRCDLNENASCARCRWFGEHATRVLSNECGQDAPSIKTGSQLRVGGITDWAADKKEGVGMKVLHRSRGAAESGDEVITRND